MDSSKPNKPEMTPGQLFQFEPAVVRQNMAKFFKKDQPYNPMTEVGSVTETSFKSIDQNDVNLRVYTPEGEGPFPAIVFFHGGGFVLCSLDTHDTLCRALCKVVGAVVISVDYRLAPEDKYPKGLEDSYAALCHVHDNAEKYNIDNTRIAVCGDSSGGNFAAVTCILAKERNGPKISFQCLLYPSTDFTFKREEKVVEPKQGGSALDLKAIKYIAKHYLHELSEENEPHVSPLKANLSNLPPAILITSQYDILRPEGIAYCQKLKESDVDCKLIDVVGQDHGFLMNWPTAVPEVKEAFAALFAALKEALSVSATYNQ